MGEEYSPLIFHGHTVVDGAGVRLTRVFGFDDTPQTDPFLLLDAFGSDDPDDYIEGFPWHPHRGIETVTYMLSGEIKHSDSLGNAGTIRDGEIQWMTAGSGIIHQEMPQPYDGMFRGFQLWINLPSSRKMTAPQYRNIHEDQIPVVKTNGAEVRIIGGSFAGIEGAAADCGGEITYLDITVEPNNEIVIAQNDGDTVLLYILEGTVTVAKTTAGEKDCVLLHGAASSYHSGKTRARFLYIAGTPLKEPVAWRGPIVMNTDQELETAFSELKNGTFIKHPVK